MKGILKYITFNLLLLVFLFHHVLVWLFIRDEEKRLCYFLRSIQLTSRVGLKLLNIKINKNGTAEAIRGRLIVSNHLSYLDVIVLFSEFPSLFVTSTEIRDTFLLGHICRLAGCFFVERRRSHRSLLTKERELSSMKEKLNQGFNVFLFPEGTSSDGKQVLPFKGTFFQLAVDTQTTVVPICLKYEGRNRDVFPWYGDMSFPDHLFKVCQEPEVEVSVTILENAFAPEKMQLAKICQQEIAQVYA